MLLRWLIGEEFACQSRRCSFDSWVRKIPWRRKSAQVYLPKKSHGQRSLAGYNPWAPRESYTTEVTEHKYIEHTRV